ncbi:MAG: GNAT family N-acetyltransferase [Chloroflexota bacterium]
MSITIQLAPFEKRYILHSMWIAYVHELSQYHDDLSKTNGLIGEQDDSCDPAGFLAEWWACPGKMFAYFICVSEQPVGFALCAAPPLADGDADTVLEEFFLFSSYRNKGIGQQAAVMLFDKLRGTWQLRVLQKNTSALVFWRRVLSQYTHGSFHERVRVASSFPLIEFRFSSTQE